MIVTPHFVYIHTSRHAGTFLNKLILQHIPDAKMLAYHGHLRDLPIKYHYLPVIGFVRNPWDWYISMFHDYSRKRQYIFQIISQTGTLDFETTIRRFLTLGEETNINKQIIQDIIRNAPEKITNPTPMNRQLPGLIKSDFENFPNDEGYYSWLFKLMYETDRSHQIYIGRFENVRDEMRRLLQLTGVKITPDIDEYLRHAQAANPSNRNKDYRKYYSNELRHLVEMKDRNIIEQYAYNF
jgi:hypothetical protein